MAETRLEAIEELMSYPIGENENEDSEPDYEDD